MYAGLEALGLKLYSRKRKYVRKGFINIKINRKNKLYLGLISFNPFPPNVVAIVLSPFWT